MLSVNEILSILKNATSRLPQLRFAWGLLGISATAALIIRLLGANKASIVIIGLTLIGVLLTFIATIAFGKATLARRPAQALIWSVTLFFIIFLSFTVTAFAISWPCNWTRFLEISTEKCNSQPTNAYGQTRPQKQILSGLIQDETQDPIPDVQVALPALGITTYTDALGRFSLQAKAPHQATVELLAQKDGYQTHRQYATMSNTQLSFTLQRKKP